MGILINYHYKWIGLSDHCIEDQMAIGTGFGQSFRGVGACSAKIKIIIIYSYSLFDFQKAKWAAWPYLRPFSRQTCNIT